jgi:hypothetical protein
MRQEADDDTARREVGDDTPLYIFLAALVILIGALPEAPSSVFIDGVTESLRLSVRNFPHSRKSSLVAAGVGHLFTHVFPASLCKNTVVSTKS